MLNRHGGFDRKNQIAARARRRYDGTGKGEAAPPGDLMGKTLRGQMTHTVVIGTFTTPHGVFGAALSAGGVGRLTFATESLVECEAWARRWEPDAHLRHDPGALAPLVAELSAYFAGELRAFTLPVDMRGTPFQVAVWRALHGVPYGEVRSYAAIAAAIGRPRAVRAVGAANGANPVPFLTPCHRIIGSGGTLTGYAGGLALKERLLALEGVRLRPATRAADAARVSPRSPAMRQTPLPLE